MKNIEDLNRLKISLDLVPIKIMFPDKALIEVKITTEESFIPSGFISYLKSDHDIYASHLLDFHFRQEMA